MGEQLTTSAEALRLFFTEDIYLVNSDDKILSEIPAEAKSAPVIETTVPVIEVGKPAVVPVIAVTELVKEVVTIPATNAVVFKYLGKNLKNILILVNDDQNDVSTDKGKELLRNIVKALQLTANDFALLNYAAYMHTGFDELKSFFKSNLILSFGVTPSHLGMEEQPVNEIIMKDVAQLIFSANLDQLADDQAGKKTLWGSLKKLSI
jgi:DNA polymerase III psi subunit